MRLVFYFINEQYILYITGVTALPRSDKGSFGSLVVDLGIGLIRALFHICGKNS
jgi:hypothetical protein